MDIPDILKVIIFIAFRNKSYSSETKKTEPQGAILAANGNRRPSDTRQNS